MDDNRAERNDEPGKISLRENCAVEKRALADASKHRRKELPDDEGREDEQRIGNVAGRDFQKFAEYHHENRHGHERANQYPENAYYCLLVSQDKVTPREHVYETPASPHLAQIVRGGSERRDLYHLLSVLRLLRAHGTHGCRVVRNRHRNRAEESPADPSQ